MFVLYDYLMRLIATPYRWAGDDPMTGFDCSGLAIEFLQAAGVLPRGYESTASGLQDFLLKNGATKTTNPTFGCLVFFGTPISHVGIVLNRTHMIEAGGGDSQTVSNEAAAKQNAFVRLRPLSWRKDTVSYVFPKYTPGVLQ